VTPFFGNRLERKKKRGKKKESCQRKKTKETMKGTGATKRANRLGGNQIGIPISDTPRKMKRKREARERGRKKTGKRRGKKRRYLRKGERVTSCSLKTSPAWEYFTQDKFESPRQKKQKKKNRKKRSFAERERVSTPKTQREKREKVR